MTPIAVRKLVMSRVKLPLPFVRLQDLFSQWFGKIMMCPEGEE
jgi:hypothetical protein